MAISRFRSSLGMLACGAVLAAAVCLSARAGAQETPAQPNPPAAGAETPGAQTAAKVPRVTTTVVVRGDVKSTYTPLRLQAADLDGASLSLAEIPLSVSAVTESLLADQGARLLSDAVKNDASVGEDYAPVGYYGDFTIRGFPIDLATAIQIDGMTVAGEQDVPLENKSQIEFVKGIAGLESGVASAGGVVNYVTRSALAVHGLDLATDHRGGSFSALDFGRAFRRTAGSGASFTVAGEDIHPYVQHAAGWRGMGAARLDEAPDARTLLSANFEYQHKVERSEAGYQLLGGTQIPGRTFPSTMLGYQPWSKPNIFDAFNAGVRLKRDFNTNWSAQLKGSYSHSLVDDNVIWPYGPALDAGGNSLCPAAPAYFFCPDGSYEIYDYRSPGELRINAVGEALAQGRFKTGAVEHNVAGGGELFHRSVDLSPTIVYTALGVENIYQPNIRYAVESPYQIASAATLADFNHQLSALVQDRARLPGGVALQAGGRYARVTDFNYAHARTEWLPQYAASWTPQRIAGPVHPLTFYANYGVLLSLGPQAPWWVDNANLFLQPYFTRQAEGGVKYESRVLLTASVFRMRQPFFYPRVVQAADAFCTGTVNPGDLCFESHGHETHTGVEVAAQGKAAEWVQLNFSAAAMRARSESTGTQAFDGKQVINVPKVRAALTADLAPAWTHGLHLMPGWSLASRKQATRDDTVSVGGYNLFNLGARYTPGGEQGRVTLRLYADNLLNKRYWKDTGASYGDTFIHLGAPATVRLSMHYRF
ncbi:MAG: TonB-dependent receptor [Terracidiphilus sp.]